MTFRFKDKERPQSYVTSLASALHEPFPLPEVLCGPYLLKKFRPDLVTKLLDLLTPDTVRVAVIGQKFEGSTDMEEEWYKTQYRVERISQETIQSWKDVSLSASLKLPPANEFIPTSFSMVPREEEQVVPCLISDNEMCRLWFKQDTVFLLPKVDVHLELISPIAYQDPTYSSMLHLFERLFSDALNEYAYAAELAGLSYSLYSTRYGLGLSVHGYHDKLRVLLRKIVEKMATFEIDEKRFEIMKEMYMRGLRNFKAEQPHQQASYYTTMLLAEKFWTKDELLEACQDISAKQLHSYISNLLSRLFVEGCFYGNLTKQDALSMYEDEVMGILKKHCHTKPVLPKQLLKHRELQLPNGSYFTFHEENSVHPSHCLEVSYQCGLQDTRENVLLELLAQLISEPCFNILRTQEQLGYLVFSGLRRAHGTQGLRLLLQSQRHPAYLEDRVEAFIYHMEKYMSDMSEEEFKKHVESLSVKRLEKPKKMYIQALKYWSEISSQQYNFDRDNIEVLELKKLTKEDVLAFYRQLLAYNAPNRHKLSVHVSSSLLGGSDAGGGGSDAGDGGSGAGGDGVCDAGGGHGHVDLVAPEQVYQEHRIENQMEFKKSLAMFPLARPYLKLPPLGTVRAGSEKSKL